MKIPEIIVPGESNGEGMVVYHQTSRGTDVFGMAVPNLHLETWDLGPTWCYLIRGRNITLIDTGRFGNLEVLRNLLKDTGTDFEDIDRIIITHSHEDHDGNLAEVIHATRAELWAHPIYRQMIAFHPNIDDGATHPEMPGSCRLCAMPEKLYKNCLPYHEKRSALKIDKEINDSQSIPQDGLRFMFAPGHSADSICIILEDEVIFTGDAVLPDITPHPSTAYAFKVNHRILPQEYTGENFVYGLQNYLRTLKRLSLQPLPVTFPSHRLYYNGQFNIIHNSAERSREIIQFHIDRCRDILRLIKEGPTTIGTVTSAYFPPSQLAGSGMAMAVEEIIAHLEIMIDYGDIRLVDDTKWTAQRTGSSNYATVMKAYLTGA